MLASAGRTACPVASIITLGFEYILQYRFGGFIKEGYAAVSLFHTDVEKKRSREGPGILFFLLESHELFETDIYVLLLS